MICRTLLNILMLLYSLHSLHPLDYIHAIGHRPVLLQVFKAAPVALTAFARLSSSTAHSSFFGPTLLLFTHAGRRVGV